MNAFVYFFIHFLNNLKKDFKMAFVPAAVLGAEATALGAEAIGAETIGAAEGLELEADSVVSSNLNELGSQASTRDTEFYSFSSSNTPRIDTSEVSGGFWSRLIRPFRRLWNFGRRF